MRNSRGGRPSQRRRWTDARFTWGDLAWVGLPAIGLQLVANTGDATLRWAFWAAYFAWLAVAPRIALRRRAAPVATETGAVVELALSIALALGYLLVTSLAWQLVQAVTPDAPARLGWVPSAPPTGDTTGYLTAITIGAVTFGPLAEETFFRGFLLSALTPRIGRVGALLVQATLFSAAHWAALGESLVLGLGGVIFGVIVLWRGRLMTAIATHVLVNAIMVALMWLALLGPRPYLGVTCETGARACTVSDIALGSPALEAGIVRGDIILAIDDEPVTGTTGLGRSVRRKPVGTPVVLRLEHAGTIRALTIVIGDRR